MYYDLVLGFKWKKNWGDTPSATLRMLYILLWQILFCNGVLLSTVKLEWTAGHFGHYFKGFNSFIFGLLVSTDMCDYQAVSRFFISCLVWE